VLAIVVFPHGAQKVLGWFGGFGFSGTYGFLTQQMHIPAALALLVFAAEFLGPIGLFFGLFGRIAAFGIDAQIGFCIPGASLFVPGAVEDTQRTVADVTDRSSLVRAIEARYRLTSRAPGGLFIYRPR